MPSRWGVTPRESVEQQCALRGKEALVAGCITMLAGRDVDDALAFALGGPAARGVLDGDSGDSGDSKVDQRYWLRVWGARGLLWAWDEVALPTVLDALRDEKWRVREMAAKVVARHRVGDAFDAVAVLRDDSVPRVRAAAERAVRLLMASGA